MPLNPSQLSALKNHIAGNTTPILYAGNMTPINELPNNADANIEIAKYYNGIASPDYWVWKPTITRSDVYHQTSPADTVWDWATFKTQSVTEQTAWIQMFMGDAAPIGLLNFRAGCFAIFAGSNPQNAQRNHIFAVGKRLANRIERLFVAPVSATGGLSPSTNNGNDTGAARGSTANPDALGFAGTTNGNEVENARNLP
jgi:hypothetical protein